ncbi:transmembrane protein 132E [Teleopsis dalmanni]|uniref:transmembrane protein 132E n=2 Tax=Teleopsis dalmanni TaxID=139649 RepID=UPI0018CFD7D4|nr:transmembrane protein 132E [Teleopsis dalmanni]
MRCFAVLLICMYTYQNNCVEVHFEAADSGFFLKHPQQGPVAPEITQMVANQPVKAKLPFDSILSIDRFTVVQSAQPVSIRASYGPFSTKQTVPARYIVPEIENQGEIITNTTLALIELQQANVHLDISAHLVRTTVPQDSPVLRVLFHAGADPGGHLQRQKICVLLHVSMGSQVALKGRCMPEGEDGVCVAEVVIPSYWWPSVPPTKGSQSSMPQKVPQKFAQVSYSVFEPPIRSAEQCEPKVQIQPLTVFAQVPLVSATAPFKILYSDEFLKIMIPQYPLYPMSKIHVPVYLRETSNQKVSAFTVKARVKSGIKILGASITSDLWNISIEKENQKHITVRVMAVQKEHNLNSGEKLEYDNSSNNIFEVFSWLLEVAEDTKETLDRGKIVWSISYIFYHSKVKEPATLLSDESKRKLISKLEINKDDIQAVLPMAKNWELMNTAVLTGRQVAQAMKVFIVSQAGKVADVTLQSSCFAEDESVIKVSSSCSSVYVDGSEIRGSSNASVIVKYGTYIGLAKFIVWMPEFPLEVYVEDIRLSQIKGWKVIDDSHYAHNKINKRRKKRSYIWGQYNTEFYNIGTEKAVCRARYQQSPIEVYARFLAIDQNSGRTSYFISRRTGLRVTDLVQPLLRIADPKIASLKGRILQGRSIGKTDVQVLSPITGRTIGAKEIRVGSDKVGLSKLIVNVVSGLQLTITPDNAVENGYIAETSVTHKLTAQYQEGLLDIDLEYMDGSKTPLRDISVEDYFLLVESLDTEVVAFAPMLASHHPRVIAVGEGNGYLLRVTLLLSEDCRTKKNGVSSKSIKSSATPLISSLASVEVDFSNIESVTKHEPIQNDGAIGRDRQSVRNSDDLTDIIVGIPLGDGTHYHNPNMQPKQHRGNIYNSKFYNVQKNRNITSMEIGMYVLLTAFCFAIVVFVISCVVYASKFRPSVVESNLDTVQGKKITDSRLLKESAFTKEPTTNAHDWVWLGRSTMDRSSIITNSHATPNVKDLRIRITTNPINNYSDNGNTRNLTSLNSIKGQPEFAKITHCKEIGAKTKSMVDYRPPVPPHRNIEVCASVNNTTQSTNINSCVGEHYGQKLNAEEVYNRSESNSFLNMTSIEQCESNCCKKPTNLFQFSPQAITSVDNNNKNCNYKELHNAEKLLVDSSQLEINIFQFDSLTSKNKSIKCIENIDVQSRIKQQQITDKIYKDALTNECMLVNGNSNTKKIKRATIVGNPMFSTINDSDYEQKPCLGLDDLEMDYEQIMHYFENLKESNA